MRVLFKNFKLVDKNGTFNGEILVEDGKIRSVCKTKSRGKRDLEINGDGLTLMPGFVDLHSHLRDPGFTEKEDLSSGLSAAAKGGYVYVCAMPNTNPVMDSKEKIEENLEKAKKVDKTGLIQVGAVTKDLGDELSDLDELSKVTPILSNDGKPVSDKQLMKEALKIAKYLPVVIATHNEPEIENIKRDLELLKETMSKLHICHVSKAESLGLIKQAKDEGYDVTCEVTPHHLYASSLQYRVNPPFGTNHDKMALIKAVKDGLIDAFGSDHAPHTQEDKQKGAPGINNFETAFGMYNTVLKENGMDLEKLSEMMSYNPRKILGLEGGELKKGEPADFVIVDEDKEWQIKPEEFISKSKNTPFGSDWLTGKVLGTYKDGKWIYLATNLEETPIENEDRPASKESE